jgi:hypothetical protein
MSWLRRLFKLRERVGGVPSQPFSKHMGDLCWTLGKIVLVQLVAMTLLFYFRGNLFRALQALLPVERFHGVID